MPITVNAYGKSLDYNDLMDFYYTYFCDETEMCMEELVKLYLFYTVK